jgi:DNA processing protein
MSYENFSEEKSFHVLNTTFKANHRRLGEVLKQYGSWQKAWEALDGKTENREIAWEALAREKIQLVVMDSEAFPALLKEIPWVPHGLYWKGEPIGIGETRIAVVGTRKATKIGKEIAEEFGRESAKASIVVVSGLALGIDAAVHKGVLEAKGRTIAVLARGLHDIYPKENEALGEEIIKHGGTLVSEYPPDMPALPHQFLERNRIVSGLSKGTVVIEAPKRSGSLATARFALEQNREVWVIPGPVKNPNYEGSHELIKTGAALVTGPEDVLVYVPKNERAELLKPVDIMREERVIVQILEASAEPLLVDKIQELSRMDITQVNQLLGMLVVKGYVVEDGGEYYLS